MNKIKIMSSNPPRQARTGRVPSPELTAARNLLSGQWFRVTGGRDYAKIVQRRLTVSKSSGALKHKVSCYLDGDDLIVYRP